MAELSTLARPYAKAVFHAANEAKKLTEWSAALSYAAVVAQDRQMQVFLDHPSLTSEQKAEAFVDVCKGKISEQGQNLIHVLAEYKRLSLLPNIAVLFEELKSLQEKSVDVEVQTAFKLGSEHKKNLAKALSAKLDRKISIRSSVDKTLIGGVIIRAGDLVIDASVKGKLAKLAEAIGS